MREGVRRAKLKSLAKINLDLRILHKRADGFHELRTVFQTISLADSIEIEYEHARKTELSIDGNVEIADNLILRAASAALTAMRLRARVHFRLRKRIPMGGGLGGGSSNAAAVLLALPALAGREVSMEEIAANLGSDVPFFLHGGTAVGLGRGTEMYPLADVEEQPILLVTPGLHVATGAAYAALRRSLTFTGSSSSINNFQAYVRAIGGARRAGPASAFSANDFEPVVFKQFPKLGRMVARLRRYTPAVRMSGSGSTLFALFESREEREKAVEGLSGERVFPPGSLMEASLVSGRGYRRLWRRQLSEHVVAGDDLWPPPSRHMGRYEQ